MRRTIDWDDNAIMIIDQCALPQQLRVLRLTTVAELIAAIQRLAVRGAPALGAAGALGAVMSGSGPTVVGVARSFEHARQIRARLTRGAWECWAVRTLSGPAVRVCRANGTR